MSLNKLIEGCTLGVDMILSVTTSESTTLYSCSFSGLHQFIFCLLCENIGLEIGGEMNLAAGIQVAQLALKHRQNKKQQQRIIVFAGRLVIPSYACDFTLFFASSCILTHFDLCVAVSAVKHEKKTLEMIGRKLKKNSVALDIINFGEEDEEKSEKLEALLAAVNNNDTSHIVHVSAGPSALSDVLIRSVFMCFLIFCFDA